MEFLFLGEFAQFLMRFLAVTTRNKLDCDNPVTQWLPEGG